MKHRSFNFTCLIIWACIMVSPGLSADDNTTDYQSKILESFNGDADAKYIWKAEGSKFITKTKDVTYPVLAYVEAWPVVVFGYNQSAPPQRSFGINGRFDRTGYNWIDIYPVLAENPDGGPYEIPIPGKVRNFDMWVWGANFRYYIEIFVRDYRGVVFAFRLGDIAHAGWKNLQVDLPANIAQSRRTLPSYAGLHFVKFRIWTQPAERVDNFYIYFKQFKVLTNMYVPLFDGNDLADPDNVQRLWTSNK